MGEVRHKIDTVVTAVGDLLYHTYFYNNENEKGISVFMVSKVEYPEESIHHDSTELLEDFFLTTMETAAESVYGELVYHQESEIKGYPGRIWRVHYNKGNAVAQTRALVAGNNYYSLQVVAPRAYSLSPEAEKFFESFRFLRSPD